jgi:outer membrane protein OmpA-like peptidoglycan-associated protein
MMKTIFMTLAFIIISSCATVQKGVQDNPRTTAGAGIGTAVGAGLGGIMGKGKGAVLGGVIGGALGAYAGNRMDKQAQELEKIAETKRTESGLVSKLKGDILFETGKSNLKPAAKKNLREMASIMKKYPENILMVKGFTDNTGSSVVNEKISRERAEAVKQELLTSGLNEQSISAQGLGPAFPIASNGTQEGRKNNRRVEIEISVDASKLPKKQL